MEWIKIVIQLIIAVSIFNVWILRFGKPTSWRGGSAKSMKDEFDFYSLPPWFMWLIGFLKLTLASLLIAGIWFHFLIIPAAVGMAVLMTGAIIMHIKVKDSLIKSLPAFTFLVLSLLLATIAMYFLVGVSPVGLGISVIIISIAVIGTHGMLSGTATMDFGGRKAAGTAVGLIDGLVYLGTGVQSLSLGFITTKNWNYWPVFLIPFAILGILFTIKIWNAFPKGKSAGH